MSAPAGSFKDLFSVQSSDYARFRPTYPEALYEWLASQAPARDLAWDCGTGSGQAATRLAERFRKVIATDPSAAQIAKASPHPNVEYRVGSAEQSGLADRSVDLVTAAQAFHWFKQDLFFRECERVLRPGGLLVFWTYNLTRITPDVDRVVLKIYKEILGPYWEGERRLVEEGYRNVKLPFQEIQAPSFEMRATWPLAQLLGYLGTWSALQAYIKKNGQNPLESLASEFQRAWGSAETREVSWPLSVRAGKVK